MPTLNDAFNELQAINANLQVLHADNGQLLAEQTAIKAAVDAGTVATQAVKAAVDAGTLVLDAIAQGQQVTNTILLHLSHQTDTLICAAEAIARNTCAILNEAHRQTKLQAIIVACEEALLDIAKTTNPGAELDRARRQSEREALERCCPPEVEPPVCKYAPCPAPPPLEIDYRPGASRLGPQSRR
jgi:hypothetical protein